MTMHMALDVPAVPGLPPSYTPAEIDLYETDLLLHWWRARDRNELRSGGKWIDRKNGAVASLLTDAQRPSQTLIGEWPVIKTPTSDTTPPTIWMTDGDVIPDDDFSIFAVIQNHGLSPGASAFGIVGNNGMALAVRARTSNLISINIDGGSAIPGRQSASLPTTDQPHLIEFGVQISAYPTVNTGYVYRDGLSIIAPGPLTGWNRAAATRRLSFASVYDAVTGIVFQGRSLGLEELLIFRGSALVWGTTARQRVAAVINEAFNPIITVAT